MKEQQTKIGNGKRKRLIRMSAALLSALMANPATPRAQTLSCPQSMLFGNYTACGSSASATITPGNSRNVTGCLNAGGAPYNRAQCNISQSFPLTNIQVSVTAAKYTIKNSTGAKMTVDNFSCRFQGTGGTVTGACVRSTTPFFLLIDIGATLNVGASQTAGSYSGTFTINTNFP